VITDVTKRMKSEAQAHELEQRYKELLAAREKGRS